MRRALLNSVLLLSMILVLIPSIAADSPDVFPDEILLPTGFFPEGIAVGRGSDFYVGSLVNGALFKGDLRTGDQLALTDGFPAGPLAVGIAYDGRSNLVYVAGGFGPPARVAVYNGTTLELFEMVNLGDVAGAVNDVVVTRDAVYLTESFEWDDPLFYRLPLDPVSGLPDAGSVEQIHLSDNFSSIAPEFNSNGIVATPGENWLLINNQFTGEVYRVDPMSGEATLIDLGGHSIVTGDGMMINGTTLYVVQTSPQQVDVIKLDPATDFTTGRLIEEIDVPGSETPTTGALFGKSVYVVDARFDTTTTQGPDLVEYKIFRVDK